LKKNRNVQMKSDRAHKSEKPRGSVQRDAKEVMAELVEKLSQKLEPQAARTSEGERRQERVPGPIGTGCQWVWIWATNGGATAFWT